MHKPAASSFADMRKCYDCQDSTAIVVQSSIDNFSNVLKQECGILRMDYKMNSGQKFWGER